jgi:hypothetical protein
MPTPDFWKYACMLQTCIWKWTLSVHSLWALTGNRHTERQDLLVNICSLKKG